MADYHLTDDQVMADPVPAYAALRRECPVHRAEVDGRPLYSVSRARDVHRILIDPGHWSNRRGPGVADSAAVAIDELVTRLPELRLAGEPARVASPFLWGRKTLPVAWA